MLYLITKNLKMRPPWCSMNKNISAAVETAILCCRQITNACFFSETLLEKLSNAPVKIGGHFDNKAPDIDFFPPINQSVFFCRHYSESAPDLQCG